MQPVADLSAAWMSPDMFVLGHCAHTCGALSISPVAIEETPMEIHSDNVNRLNE